jgi:hypothetical protein
LAPEAQEDFWKAIRKTVRSAEENRPTSSESGPPFECTQQARFGVSKDMAQINYTFLPSDFAALLAKGGFSIDFKNGVVSEAVA